MEISISRTYVSSLCLAAMETLVSKERLRCLRNIMLNWKQGILSLPRYQTLKYQQQNSHRYTVNWETQLFPRPGQLHKEVKWPPCVALSQRVYLCRARLTLKPTHFLNHPLMNFALDPKIAKIFVYFLLY